VMGLHVREDLWLVEQAGALKHIRRMNAQQPISGAHFNLLECAQKTQNFSGDLGIVVCGHGDIISRHQRLADQAASDTSTKFCQANSSRDNTKLALVMIDRLFRSDRPEKSADFWDNLLAVRQPQPLVVSAGRTMRNQHGGPRPGLPILQQPVRRLEQLAARS